MRRMEGVHVDSFVPVDNALFHRGRAYPAETPKVCRWIRCWDPHVRHVYIMEHVPLRQSIKGNLCPVTPEELNQPQGVVST